MAWLLPCAVSSLRVALQLVVRFRVGRALYHITSRGNARQRIFVDDADRRGFLEILTKAIERFNWLCHAYCLHR